MSSGVQLSGQAPGAAMAHAMVHLEICKLLCCVAGSEAAAAQQALEAASQLESTAPEEHQAIEAQVGLAVSHVWLLGLFPPHGNCCH